ncbi:MAG: uroporphyrinogen decarboxylase family protein, partial [Spirochaetia bacterium]
MKSSRENVVSAIEFRRPDRLPVMFDAFGVSDVHSVRWNQIGTGDHTLKLTFDEWYCGWSRSEVNNMGQVTMHPLDSWKKLESYRWPDPDDPAFYEGMEARFSGGEDKYILTEIFMVLFERMHSLRGFQNLLTDLLLEQEKVGDLADRIVEIDERIIANISQRFPGMIQGIIFTDDWGTERNLTISPELWIEFFQPRYRKIFDACKNAGWHVWLHSCGKINEIIGNLIDVGVDVLNLQQPTLLGIEEIGRKYSG